MRLNMSLMAVVTSIKRHGRLRGKEAFTDILQVVRTVIQCRIGDLLRLKVQGHLFEPIELARMGNAVVGKLT